MAKKAAAKAHDEKNIFCLETYSWYSGEDRTTVRPILELLEKMEYCKYLYRDVATREEFNYFIDEYFDDEEKREGYPILYLNFHGSDDPPGIYLGNGKMIGLEELAVMIGRRCSNRLIHFGSCSTMNLSSTAAKAFLERTQAVAVCGYKGEVDWLQSAAFEVLILGTLKAHSFTKRGMEQFGDRLKEQAAVLHKKLKFNIRIR